MILYQVRDANGNVLFESSSLTAVRATSVDLREGCQIVERSFIEGEWEEVVLYERMVSEVNP